MNRKIKISAEVWAQLENHPTMKEQLASLMDDEGRIEIRDEVWNRDTEECGQSKEAWPELPEVVETGLTIGDLLKIFGKADKQRM